MDPTTAPLPDEDFEMQDTPLSAQPNPADEDSSLLSGVDPGLSDPQIPNPSLFAQTNPMDKNSGSISGPENGLSYPQPPPSPSPQSNSEVQRPGFLPALENSLSNPQPVTAFHPSPVASHQEILPQPTSVNHDQLPHVHLPVSKPPVPITVLSSDEPLPSISVPSPSINSPSSHHTSLVRPSVSLFPTLTSPVRPLNTMTTTDQPPTSLPAIDSIPGDHDPDHQSGQEYIDEPRTHRRIPTQSISTNVDQGDSHLSTAWSSVAPSARRGDLLYTSKRSRRKPRSSGTALSSIAPSAPRIDPSDTSIQSHDSTLSRGPARSIQNPPNGCQLSESSNQANATSGNATGDTNRSFQLVRDMHNRSGRREYIPIHDSTYLVCSICKK